MNGGASGNRIVGNYIGTDKDGEQDLGNDLSGVTILLPARGTVVGGATEGERNVISGNDQNGIGFGQAGATGNKVSGNYIGTDKDGEQDLGNTANGILILDAPKNKVGGAEEGAANLVSGNDHSGIVIQNAGSTGNEVSGNSIGTNAAGDADLGNTGDGMLIQDAPDNTVGGAGAGNVVSHNGESGVAVTGDGATGNSILSNSVYANEKLGIDLKNDGVVTPNDEDDGDGGPNSLQNFSVLDRATVGGFGDKGVISGTLNSTPSSTFKLLFFSSPEPDPSGNGEGKTFLGEQEVSADANGDARFSFGPADVAPGKYVTATATRQGNSATPVDDTSEFSNAIPVTAIVDLSLEKEAPASVADEDEFDYDITVTNNDPFGFEASGVTVEDTLPEGVEFVRDGTDERCTYDANARKATCELGALGTASPGNPALFTIRVKARTLGEKRNTTTVSADNPDINNTNDTDAATTTVGAPTDPASFEVDRSDDPSVGGDACTPALQDCSLRGAVLLANARTNAATGPDTIVFDPSVSTVVLSINTASGDEDAAETGDLDPAESVTVDGSGAGVTVDTDPAFRDRLLEVRSPAIVELKNLTLRNGGRDGSVYEGGGIYGGAGATLKLTDSTVSFNSAELGGGIFVRNATLELTGSTVSSNSAGYGGGIFSDRDTTLKNSTVSGNSADQVGGGVFNYNGLATIRSSTITDNTAPADRGSGVASSGDGSTRTEVGSSIVAANENTDVDFVGGDTNYFSSGNYNLVGDGNATGVFNGTGDQTNVSDPRLGPLADNGGPTKTHALLVSSPAIDKGNTDLTVDQRGQPRSFDDPHIPPATGGDDSDIGSFEAQEVLNTAPDAINDDLVTDEDTLASINVLTNDTDPEVGDDLDIASFSQGRNGSVACDSETGVCRYTPDDDFNGEDSFTYKASDGKGGEDAATVTITVRAVNDAPGFDLPSSPNQTVDEDAGKRTVANFATNISPGPSNESDQNVSFDVTNNNSSLFTAAGQPKISYDGTLTYTPAKAANGTATVSVKATDDGGTANGGVNTSAAQAFKITVSPVNDAPTVAIAAGGQCGTSGTSGQINLTVGDVESAPSALTLSATSSNQNLVPNSGLSVGGGTSRTLTVSAAANRSGTATITVRVSDGQGSSTVPVTVKVGSDSTDTLGGTPGADIIFGKNGANTTTGGGGNDLLCGGNGSDVMSGGAGDDTLDGANGNDVLRGDAGKDILRGGSGDDTLNGGTDADSFSGGAGTDKATDFNAAEGDTKDATVP